VDGCDLTLILRYRKAVTYGFHVLLGALDEHRTATRYEVRFGESVGSTVVHIRKAVPTGSRVLVLWLFCSPDAEALAAEVHRIKTAAPGALQVAGGVHATAEPVHTLDAGKDVAAVGEGETTLRKLVAAGGARPAFPASVTATVPDAGADRRPGGCRWTRSAASLCGGIASTPWRSREDASSPVTSARHRSCSRPSSGTAA
jgi:hypothetical protein